MSSIFISECFYCQSSKQSHRMPFFLCTDLNTDGDNIVQSDSTQLGLLQDGWVVLTLSQAVCRCNICKVIKQCAVPAQGLMADAVVLDKLF